jgi:hypothetical protein
MPLPVIPANLLNTMVQTAMNNNAGIGIKAPQQLPQIPMVSAANQPPTQSAQMPQIPMLSAKNKSMLPTVPPGAKITKYEKPQKDFGLNKFTNLNYEDILKPTFGADNLLRKSFDFEFTSPQTPDQQANPQSFIQQQFGNLATSLEETNKTLVGAQDDLKKASEKVAEILNSQDVEKALNEYNKFVNDASKRPKFEMATARDYFYDKTADGKEKLSNRGLATIIISALGSIFAPAQFRQQNAEAPTRLASQFADVENKTRQVDFQNSLQTYNDSLQSLKNNISFAEQKNKRELGVAQFGYNKATSVVNNLTNITNDQRKQLTDLAIKSDEIAAKGSDAERKTMITTGVGLYKSDDPNQRLAGFTMLYANGINVPIPPDATLGQKKKEADIGLVGEKIAGEKQTRDLKTKKDVRDEAILDLKKKGFGLSEKNINDTIRHRKFMEGIASRRAATGEKNANNYQSLTKESKWNADFLKNQYNEINASISKAEADLAKKKQNLNFAKNSTDPDIKGFTNSLQTEVDGLNTKIKGLKTQKQQILIDVQDIGVLKKTGGLIEPLPSPLTK